MNEADLQPLVEWLNSHPSWILFSVFFISFLESLALAGIVVPGVLLLFVVSAASGKADLPLLAILFSGFVGAVLGDGISFYLGRYFKSSLRGIWPFSKFPKLLDDGELFFSKHGGKSVMIGRFVGPIRPVIPIIAGMLEMSPSRFAFFNIASAIIWAPFYIIPGYLTGIASNYMLPEQFSSVILSLLFGIAVLLLVFRFLNIKLQHNSALYSKLLFQNQPKLIGRLLSQLSNRPIPSLEDTSAHNELPLASFLLFSLSLTFFIVWSTTVTQTNWLLPIDNFLNDSFSTFREANIFLATGINYIAIFFTLLGDEAFLYISFTCFVAYQLSTKHYVAGLVIAVAGITTAFVTHGLKNYWMIERPDLVIGAPSSFAYPSGHTSGATVLFGLCAAFIAQGMQPQNRWKCYLSFGLPICFVALSRVMLNVHWFSDIIGGLLLGFIICGATRVVYSRYYARDTQHEIRRKSSLLIWLSIWLILLFVYQSYFFTKTLALVQLAHHG